MRASAAHLDAATQLASVAQEDKAIAARWITVALAPDLAGLQKRLLELPRIRDLDDAQARLEYPRHRDCRGRQCRDRG